MPKSTRIPKSPRPVMTVAWPRVPWAAGYGLKSIYTIDSLQRQTAGEPNTPYHETTPSLQAEEMGPPT
jgi:hypothetical protein